MTSCWRGADINAKRQDGARPIQLTNGDYNYRGWRDVAQDWPTTPAQVLAHLRARGANVDLCTACQIGELERVRELLDEDPTLANRLSEYVTYYLASGAPLKNAAAAGHLEIVKLLLERGADPNLPEEGIAPHGHALYSAAAKGHYEIAKLLLEYGAYPNPEVESSGDALSRAIANSDQRMIDLLCSYGAARGVHLLAYDGDVQTAAAVFAANPALADNPDALTNAAGEGQEAFVRLLLRYQPELPKRLSFPAWSVGGKTRELNTLLFQHGMNPSQPDWLRITPLHHFARNGDVEKASLFIEHGADLHARDEDICSTPLGWAAKFGKMDMVELLLQHGAKPNLPDDSPDLLWATPLAWATRRGHGEIVELLKQHGAIFFPGFPLGGKKRKRPRPTIWYIDRHEPDTFISPFRRDAVPVDRLGRLHADAASAIDDQSGQGRSLLHRGRWRQCRGLHHQRGRHPGRRQVRAGPRPDHGQGEERHQPAGEVHLQHAPSRRPQRRQRQVPSHGRDHLDGECAGQHCGGQAVQRASRRGGPRGSPSPRRAACFWAARKCGRVTTAGATPTATRSSTFPRSARSTPAT